MKKYSIILIFTVVIFILFGFIFLNKKSQQKEIVFWTLQMGDYKEYINDIISGYEKTHDIKIKWVDVPFSEGEKRTLSAMLSKNPPDLINLNPDFSILLAEKGALTYIEREALKDFADDIVNSLTYNNKIFAIPWYATSSVTFYNKKLVKDLDIKIAPKKYDDFAKIASKLNNRNVFVYMPTINENDTMLKILNKYGINSPETINSTVSQNLFKMFKDMYILGQIPKESVTQTQREALEKYMSGQIVYFQAGANFLNMVRDNAPNIYAVTDILPQITGSVGQNDFSLMNLVIPLKSSHPKEALDFGLYLTNAQNQYRLAEMTNIISTNKEVLKKDFYNMENSNDLIAKARSVSSKQLNNVNPVMRHQKNQKEINLLINTAVQEILLNNADIEQTLDDVAQKWKQFIEK